MNDTDAVERERSLESAVLRESLDSLARANRRGVWLSVLLVPLVAWRLSAYTPDGQFLAWVAAMLTVAIIRSVVVRAYLRRPPAADQLARWQRRFVAIAALVGLSWSVLAWPTMVMGQNVRLLVLCVLMAIAAIGLFSFHAMAEAFAAFMLPIIGSMLCAVMAEQIVLAREVALLVPLFGVIMVIGSRLVSANVADVIRARWRADELSRAARAASESKSRFLASMSHEIRTPINGMMGMAELLASAKLAPPHDHYAQSVLDAGASLLSVVDDVLDFAKIQASQLSLRPAACGIAEWIERQVQPYKTLANQRGLRFVLEIDPALPPRIMVDAQRLGQTIGNLLSNALKFTERGQIGVALRRVGQDRWSVTVSDTGIGIDAVDVQRIFEPFTQVDASAGRRYGGTGLGLSIVRQIAQLMGGDVRCDSVLAEGSQFTITLPLVEADAPAPAPEPDGELQPLHGLVLIAEDNPLNLEITTLFVKSMGLEVVSAANGAEAVAQFHAHQPDAILMDCEMPGIDGLEATRRIRADAPLSRVPIIALTAHAMPEDRQAALDAGMDDYLSKPVDRLRLYRMLRAWLTQARDE